MNKKQKVVAFGIPALVGLAAAAIIPLTPLIDLPTEERPPAGSAEQKEPDLRAKARVLDEIERSSLAPTAVTSDDQAELARDATLAEVLTEKHAELVAMYGAEEADFRAAIITTVGDWQKTKELITQREAETGANYSELLMRAGFASGDILADEIIELVDNGVPIPDYAFHRLAYAGKAETIAALVEHGYFSNVNLLNPATGANAIGTFIQRAGHLPDRYPPEKARDILRQFIEIGVDPRGCMTQALRNVNSSNADTKLALVKELVKQGVPLTEQDRKLVAKMKDGPYKERFLSLF